MVRTFDHFDGTLEMYHILIGLWYQGLYMGKNDLGTLPLFSVGTWTLWIFHTQIVTLIFFLKE